MRRPKHIGADHPHAAANGFPADDQPADYLPVCTDCNRRVAKDGDTLCQKCADEKQTREDNGCDIAADVCAANPCAVIAKFERDFGAIKP